jgi:hypothetical protein
MGTVRLKGSGLTPSFQLYKETNMKMLTDLLTTDYGLMSLVGIIFMLGMAVWFRLFFIRKMNEDEQASAKAH